MATHPNNTQMEPDTEISLNNLVGHPNVFMAVISGRGPQDAKNKVGLPITYAGNHGLEIFYADGTKWNYEIAPELRTNMTRLVAALESELAVGGAWVENKNASLSFHYREVPQAEHERLAARASELIRSFGYQANPAHCAVEAKPPVHWNKGDFFFTDKISSFSRVYHFSN